MAYFELAKSINGKGAFRVIRAAKTKKEIEAFVKSSPGENLYMSVYKFRETSDGKPVYASAVTDKIFIDLDSDGHSVLTDSTWRDLQRLIDWCKAESTEELPINPQIFFSGGSGYHVIFKLERAHISMKSPVALQQLTKKIREKSGVNTIDLQANHGFTQLRRIPNTQHQKTGKYCIPLTIDEAYNYEPDGILKLATKPRRSFKTKVDSSKYFDEVIDYLDRYVKVPSLREKVDRLKRRRRQEKNQYLLRGDLGKIRPCIKQLVYKENPTFQERTWIACELIRCGYGGEKDGEYLTERIHDIFKDFDKYTYDITEAHLKKLIDKGIYAPSCTNLQSLGICDGKH